MIINPRVTLHRLILSLSEALDFVHPLVADHQQRVAYIALNLARQMMLSRPETIDLFHAAALHDIGLIRLNSRRRNLGPGDVEGVAWHAEAGYELLGGNPLFAQAANIVRHHHVTWDHGQGARHLGVGVPLASHVLALADNVERAIDKSAAVLDQVKPVTEKVRSLSGKTFHPECVEAFCEVSQPEAFWLDCVCTRMYSVLLQQMDWPSLHVDEQTIEPIAKTFARIVDARSHWTATHSVGVTATAVALAQRLRFSPREVFLMRAAGYLHDLGKLSVPTEILEKPGKLTREEENIVNAHSYHTFRILQTIGGMPQVCEWAAFHHERLDGTGYPFRHSAKDLTLGARIMAVADVFTAVTEDRPYRQGMGREQALDILESSCASGGLDGDVVGVLKQDYDAIDAIRRQDQLVYAENQTRLEEIMGVHQPAGC